MTFEIPEALHATEPPEARGLRRDEVRLMVSTFDATIAHRRFDELPAILRAGDLVVVNTSRTLNASIAGERAFGMDVEVHLSTLLPGGLWIVEVRQRTSRGSQPLRIAMAGEVITLPDGGRASLLAPYPFGGDLFAGSRLWTAALELPTDLHEYLDEHGAPIRYSYVAEPWPLEYYQTLFAAESGSAEMPSAGRPFTSDVVTDLERAGVSLASIVLHTGVSSQEDHEPPYVERFEVGPETASRVNATHASGGRVIAVGTTVVRALETVTDEAGITHPGRGWTDLVIASDASGRGVRAVDGLLTGFHEPAATHLAILRAIARRGGDATGASLEHAYRAALERGYRWHEFGDVHLLLPR